MSEGKEEAGDKPKIDMESAVLECVVSGEKDVPRILPFILHEIIDDDKKMVEAITKYVKDPETTAESKDFVLEFIDSWCCNGKQPSLEVLQSIVHLLIFSFRDNPVRAKCIESINAAIDYKSPVLGRWKANLSPRSNLLVFMDWDVGKMAVAFTAMCLPFFKLRAHEFGEGNPGKHLKDLNLRYNAVSSFVTESILVASVLSKKQGVQVMERWLDIAKHLHDLRNYHMLFAVQNGLQKHQVDRLDGIINGLSKKSQKFKAKMDKLFDVTNRMYVLIAELQANVGKGPMIPCIFWLVQKAVLLREAPLLNSDGKLNMDRIVAGKNVFGDMKQMQDHPYVKLKEDEQILWYLMRLERNEEDNKVITGDDLYILSDAAKTHFGPQRKRSTSLIGAPRRKSIANSLGASPSSSPDLKRDSGSNLVGKLDENAVSILEVLKKSKGDTGAPRNVKNI